MVSVDMRGLASPLILRWRPVFNHIGPVNRRRGLTSRLCLRNPGMERFAHSAKIHLHEYPTRDGAHIEVSSFDSLCDGGSEREVVVWEIQKKNHGP